MPRIDPQQLLNCLQVLLSPTGGILSRNEVQRLASLMTKFSKKLVSKCIYVLILKNTERHLLGSFMGEGGWNLIHLWLQDAHINKNWALVSEVLELLLLTPVDVERLKMNNLPKLVKGLSKREDLPGVQQLASSIVEQWLTIVKDVTKQEQLQQQQHQVTPIEQLHQQQQHLQQQQQQPQQVIVMESAVTMLLESGNDPEPMEIDETINNDANTIVSENGVDTSLRIKFVRDGKQVISRVVAVRTEDADVASTAVAAAKTDATDAAAAGAKNEDSEGTDKENSDKKQQQKSVPKKSSSSSSSKSSSSSSSSSRDKDKYRDRSKGKSSSNSRSSSSKSGGSSSSRDKDRKERDRDRDRHKHNGSSSSSKHRSSSGSGSKSGSSSSRDKDKDRKETKEKQAEKDKDTLAKIQPQTLQKIGRIPKKAEDGKDKKEPKKSSFSVEVRKATEEKPKTVKVYNSKMRSTGLMEEAKPPPPRSATKKTAPAPTLPATIPAKRPSPVRDTIPPPEKKSRLIDPEKGGIKLIPPKPKPAVLQESDIFMDALTASATTKKEPKKRKRRTSTSKDNSPPTSPSGKPSTPTSPNVLKNITPANFYQDTLVTDADEEGRDKEDDATAKDEKSEGANEDEREIPDTPAEPDDEPAEETTKTDANGLKGVLSYGKRKGPKRSIRWRPDADLVEVQYFELDETERVNVMKPFMDMQRMEMSSEREALRQRKLPNEDLMEVQIAWRVPIEIECAPPPAELGVKSLEKNIQFAREKTVLQALYFNNRVPDAPAEPDHELHVLPAASAIIIPLHDPDQPEQEAPVHPWPEAKGSPPHMPSTPAIFNQVAPQQFLPGPNAFVPNGLPQFAPAFAPPGMLNRPPGEWNLLPNGMPAKFPPPELLQQVPPMFDSFANGPGGPGPGGPLGPGGPEGFEGFVQPGAFQNAPNPMPQMFPPNNFNNNMRGRGGFRRGGPNNGPWLRMGAPNQGGGWNNQNRGRGFCNSFKQKGYCRNRDNCPYIH